MLQEKYKLVLNRITHCVMCMASFPYVCPNLLRKVTMKIPVPFLQFYRDIHTICIRMSTSWMR